jgi:hypothetical protein
LEAIVKTNADPLFLFFSFFSKNTFSKAEAVKVRATKALIKQLYYYSSSILQLKQIFFSNARNLSKQQSPIEEKLASPR